MIIFSSITLVQGLSTKSAIYSSLIETTNKQRDASIKFKSTPNIYLIHLESYQSPTAMEKLYDFDNKEFINELSKNDFFVARNNFSNYYDTLTSVGAMFLQQHHYYKVSKGIFDSIGIRDMIGGRTYNPTLAILKNNGYKINFIHSHVYTFMGNDYLDYYHPSNSLHDSLLILQSSIIDAARKSLFKINTLSKRKMNISEGELVEKILWDKLEESNATDQPSFYYINHWGAIHTPPNGAYTWKDNREERWMNYYTETVKSVNSDLLKMTNKIISMDPEGIIILYGDHGSMLYRDVWTDNKHNVDINDLIYQRKMLSAENLSLDIFGTFLAVRYLNGNPNFQDGETHVNLFRNLFSTLAENVVLLEYKPENNSYLYDDNKLYLMIEDGVPLERIVTLEK